MSDVDSSSSNSSSSDDKENVGGTSDSESSSSSSDESDKQDDSKDDGHSWMLGNSTIQESHNSSGATNHDANNMNSNEEANSSSSSSEDDSHTQQRPRKTQKEDLRSLWESNPQVYGVRRSSRARKEPERLTSFQDSDDSDGHGGGRGRKRNSGKKEDYMATLSDSDSGEESTSEFDSPPAYHHRKLKNRTQQRSKDQSGRPSKLSQMRARLEGKKKGANKRKNIKGKRQGYSEITDETSSEDDDGKPQRTSSRIQKSKISYKEESQDETDSDDVVEVVEKEDETANSECVERVMDDRVGKPGAIGGRTTWYAVENEGDPNEDFDSSILEGEQHFFIKWKGWSHFHNTWESENSLREQKVRGIKKFENYVKKKEELDAWLKVASPEDAEYFLCQQELGRDLVTTYRQVERVIAKSRVKNRFGFWDYQVKWKGLPYGECTWEDGELINKFFRDKIEKFETRQENGTVPRRDGKKRQHTKFVPIKDTEHWLQQREDCSLRDYQIDGVNWLGNSWCRNNSVILADEMGLGKTIQSITFLSYLYHVHDVYGPFLIIVPLSTIASWQREFQIWAPFMNVIVFVGDAVSRGVIRDVEWVFPNKKLKFNVVLTTYEILLKEKAFLGSHTWSIMAVDEAHRLKNDDSLLYRSLIEFRSHHRLLITGTPLQNSLKELWALLHFIMPEKFDSWPEFEDSHSNERETGYTSLHKILQPFLLRRVKKDVEKSLPAKVERILRVEMSSIQKQYYRWILTKNYRELTKGAKGKVSSFCNIVMELKKCCNHAFLTKPNEKEPASNEEKLQTLIKSSGKMILLDKLLKRLREDGHRVLIFSQMVRMLNLLQQYLILNRIAFQRLDGSIKGETRRQALERFNAPGSEDFCFLLSTRAGGLGINLASADTVIIFDSDWNPQNDLQAQARAHRIGQTNQVNIYRLVCVSSVEEDIIERAKRKMVLDHLVIQRMDTSGKTVLSKNNAPSASTGNPFNKEELSAILKFGAEDLFKEPEGDENEPECDIDEILRRAETTEDQAETGVGGELLSAFKFATFTFDEDEETMSSTIKNEDDESRDGLKTWDDIIPEADRRIIEEEERRKQEAELYLPPRIRKSLKLNAGGSDSEGGSEDSDSGSDDDEPEENDVVVKKRGRARKSQKDEIPGFTSGEVRKFLKSFRKFGNPLERLDAIARDAELTVQSEADLKRLGEQLHTKLSEMLQAHNKALLEILDEQTQTPSQQTSKRGPSFRIGGASVSVKTTMACIEDLQPLVEVMPKDAEDRKNFRLTIPVKPIRGWDCSWSSEDDSNLLIGIYEYGMGSWEQIQSEPSLGLEKKILRPNNEKPQAKQLQSRVEYLMKLLRKTKELGRAPTATTSASNTALSAAASRVARKVRQGKKADTSGNRPSDDTPTKKRSRKIKSKARVEVADDSDVDMDAPVPIKKESKSRKMQKKSKSNSMPNNADNDAKNTLSVDQGTEAVKHSAKDKSRKIKKRHKAKGDLVEDGNNHSNKKKTEAVKPDRKINQGPVHITAASDPVPIGPDDFSGDLDGETFKVCKERMRPVKKVLKLLDKPPPDAAQNEKAQSEHMNRCILKIGDRVIECLKEFHDLEKIKTWRRNLWIFVSRFTEYNAQGLYKVYKKASRRREEEKRKLKSKHTHRGSGDHAISNAVSPTQSSASSKKDATSHTNTAGKKRGHSAGHSRGAGDGPAPAPKRSYNPTEHQQRDRQAHHPNPRKSDSFHESSSWSGSGSDSEWHISELLKKDHEDFSSRRSAVLSDFTDPTGKNFSERYSPSRYSTPQESCRLDCMSHYMRADRTAGIYRQRIYSLGSTEMYSPGSDAHGSDDRPGRESPGKHSRYHGQGHPREIQHDDRRYHDEDFRFGPPRHGWSRHEDDYRYHRDEDYRRRDYEDRRYPYPEPHYAPRDEKNYPGPRWSPYSDHGPPHHADERRGNWDGYANSNRAGSPFHHHSRNRTPMHSQYLKPGRPPHPGVQSPCSSQQEASPDRRGNAKETYNREMVT